MGDAELTLHESAELLGVHYMTVYRYVRLGLLHADKVKGTWRVDRSDLAAFQAGGDAVASDPVGGPVDNRVGRRRAPWAERLEARLIAGDAAGSWGVMEAALASGAKLDELYLNVLTPALHSIGARWARGELDVSVEHRASGIAMRLVGRLGPRFMRRGRTRGAVILGAPAGEHHALSLAMLSDVLRHHGWDVSDLGGDVPTSGFVHMVKSSDCVVAVGLSVTRAEHLSIAAEAISEIRIAAPTVRVIIGGMAILDQDHARALGADDLVSDARRFVTLLDMLDSEQNQPSTDRTPVR